MIKKGADKELLAIRDQIKIAIHAALQEALKQPLRVRVLSSTVTHEVLQPSGDQFNISLRVEVHPKREEKNDVPTNP